MAQKSVSAVAPRRGFKEFIRKFFVGLKRNPHNIAMLMILISFVFYSLNLTNIADTTAKVMGKNMGQCEFASMLLGMLAFVSFIRAFPRREKPKMAMIVLTILMDGAMIFCDILYNIRINQALTRVDPAPIVINEENTYILTAQSIVSVHIILLIVTIALIVLLPVYSKLIKKINTSIDVAGNDDLGSIDIGDED